VVSLAVTVLGVLGGSAIHAQDVGPAKNKVRVPGGLAFSDFKGYESWQTISISYNERLMSLTVGNPAMIKAYQAGIPGNGQPFPDGARMAKIHWVPKKLETFPGTMVPGVQNDVDFMLKDSKRFADSGGWGYAAFKYDAASDTFRPFNETDQPPQANDAKCGAACHTIARAKDYVFTEYGRR
jgi:hypothetical protein